MSPLRGYTSATPGFPQEGFFTIEIEPIPDARYWAFVSITNNETQHVTLVTP